MTPTVRPATPADLDGIVAIERAVFPDPWTARAFANVLDNPAITFLVAQGDGPLLGYVIAWLFEHEGEIANLAVAPSARRLGVGGLLLDTILREADEIGCDDVLLEVRESNSAARALYSSRLFRPVGRRRQYYHHPVEDAIILGRHAPSEEPSGG